MTKINECFNPNCKDPTEVYVRDSFIIGREYWVQCDTCGMRGPKSEKSKKDAMRLWEETRIQYVLDTGELAERDIAIRVLVQHATRLKEELDRINDRRNDLMQIYEAKRRECIKLKTQLNKTKLSGKNQ